jgi:hypothetical protein
MTVSDTHVPVANAKSKPAVKRRTERVHIVMPVRISGGTGEATFDELTETAIVSAHGCLVRLKGSVAKSDELLIVNPATQQQVIGSVVFLAVDKTTPREVGIEFAVPTPLFWGITFPPTDWDPSERKLPSKAVYQPKKK